ncbi:hypothetical protein PAPYR_5185 [Paratrimastix pyriformis]|uniref:WIBG Mago-binding domain-containing protein n=1 Tax=Paratrimastix pyriformis TaxID=342808 RepID=A0ABQ8ULR1_9EUKA|nr:hypothetical protein PAPYR_5185 [Paratrimastix pyriformis]
MQEEWSAPAPEQVQAKYTVVRGSMRPDGTFRKDVRVKAGYMPQEEVAAYVAPGRTRQRLIDAGFVPGGIPKQSIDVNMMHVPASIQRMIAAQKAGVYDNIEDPSIPRKSKAEKKQEKKLDKRQVPQGEAFDIGDFQLPPSGASAPPPPPPPPSQPKKPRAPKAKPTAAPTPAEPAVPTPAPAPAPAPEEEPASAPASAEDEAAKKRRQLKKKLKQARDLQTQLAAHPEQRPDPDQQRKVAAIGELEAQLAALGM